MRSAATTVDAYLASLPADRRPAIETLLSVVRENLPRGYEESFAFGMITWQVPLAVYPDTYNKQPLMYAGLASQKSHMAVYLCSVYGDDAVRERFEARWARSGKKKLDMGKSCVRFRKLDDVALDAVAEAVAAIPMDAFVRFAKSLREKPAKKAAAKKTPAKNAATKNAPAKKAATTNAPAKKTTVKKKS